MQMVVSVKNPLAMVHPFRVPREQLADVADEDLLDRPGARGELDRAVDVRLGGLPLAPPYARRRRGWHIAQAREHVLLSAPRLHLAHEGLPLVDRHVRVADE